MLKWVYPKHRGIIAERFIIRAWMVLSGLVPPLPFPKVKKSKDI